MTMSKFPSSPVGRSRRSANAITLPSPVATTLGTRYHRWAFFELVNGTEVQVWAA